MEAVLQRPVVFQVGVALAFVSVVLLAVLLPRPAPSPCCGCSGCGCVALVVAAILATVFLHEALHVVAARLVGVRGLRVRFEPRLVSLILDYEWMTPLQYVVVALAPQLLSIVLLIVLVAIPGYSLVAWPSLVVNVAGGIPDMINAIYFGLVHGDARRFWLLYDEKGRVVGGVVEYVDKLVVYDMVYGRYVKHGH